MKKVVITLLFSFCAVISFAQSESVKPTRGVELDREVAFAIIEEKAYQDVIVTLKAADFNAFFVDGVKIIITDADTGKKIYKKRFSKSYLYAFSDGTIQVGKGNALTQLTLYKSKISNNWLMEVRKNGIY